MDDLRNANSFELSLFCVVLYYTLGITNDADKQAVAQDWVCDMIESGVHDGYEIIREAVKMEWK